jgi:hypothetical protein
VSQITLDMISAGLLAFGALVCFDIYLLRRNLSISFPWFRPEWVWILASIGLFYLCADEFFDLHSQYDFWIHAAMEWKETAITDRIDDAIIGCYIVAAIIILWLNRQEFIDASGRSHAFSLLRMGMVLAGIHVCCDMLSNRNDFWHFFLADAYANIAYKWTSMTEQITEIGAEVALVGSLLLIWRECTNRLVQAPKD